MDLCPQVDSQVCSNFDAGYSNGLIQLHLHKFHPEYTALSSYSSVPTPSLRLSIISDARVCRNYLVLLIGDDTPVNYKDIVCITALVASISLETLADEQQWKYQNTKHAKPSISESKNPSASSSSSVSYCKPEDLKRGFLTGGLFRYSRHPNFACEQANWYFFYAFGCIATVLPCYPWCFFVLIGSGHCGIGLLLDLWRLL
jgi:steroid 5-alpha reductase family enzyme